MDFFKEFFKMNLPEYMQRIGQQAREVAQVLARSSTDQKNNYPKWKSKKSHFFKKWDFSRHKWDDLFFGFP